MSEYLEPSDRVVRLLRDIYRNGPIIAVYDGDPDMIPESSLPAICVVQQRDSNDEGSATGLDDLTCEIQIRVVYNKMDDWDDGINEDTDLTDRKIRRLVEARDATTNRYLPTSIKGALRQQLELDDGAYLKENMRFELGSVIRPSSNYDDGLPTREGVLTIFIEYYVQRPLMP